MMRKDIVRGVTASNYQVKKGATYGDKEFEQEGDFYNDKRDRYLLEPTKDYENTVHIGCKTILREVRSFSYGTL